MTANSLQMFSSKIHAAWGPLNTQLIADCGRNLEILPTARASEDCLAALLFRFTERDLKVEDAVEHTITRYGARDGDWTARAA